QGGRRCYVVRMGDPVPPLAPRSVRLPQLSRLLPGYPAQFSPSPADRSSWSGAGHIFGLSDVSFLCLPDLPDAVAADQPPVEVPADPPPAPEQFVECSTGEIAPPRDIALRGIPEPRCDEQGYADWAVAIHLVADMVSRQRREVQFVAAIPLPAEGSDAERNLFGYLVGGSAPGPLGAALSNSPSGVATAFVQFVFPWVKSPGSAALPGQTEPGDGALTGVLARNALTRGSYRSAANLDLKDIFDFVPVLGREAWNSKAGEYTFPERVTLLGPTPSGLRVLSDVTTSLNESYRPASINRLVSAIVRAARRAGEDSTFEVSGEALWGQLRERLNSLLRGLFTAGALRGATAAEAFNVRCDRSTMSQRDLDTGRVIAVVQFEATAPIDTISVVLAFQADQQVAVLSEGA
ncbi:MAG: hypothetical protein SGI92_05240, partial [Bryobacteraceae bacterium]|nr:hypothetical protein [Bryobacteraceae bacterium]